MKQRKKAYRKKRHAFYFTCLKSVLFHCVDLKLKTGLLVSGGILMINTLRNGRIDHGCRFGEKFNGFFIVAAFDHGIKLFDCGFNFGLVVLVKTGFLCVYDNTFFSGFNVRHCMFSFYKACEKSRMPLSLKLYIYSIINFDEWQQNFAMFSKFNGQILKYFYFFFPLAERKDNAFGFSS